MLYRRAHIRDCARHMGVIFPVVLLVSGLIFIAQLLGDTVALALPASSLWQFLALAVLKLCAAAAHCLAVCRRAAGGGAGVS